MCVFESACLFFRLYVCMSGGGGGGGGGEMELGRAGGIPYVNWHFTIRLCYNRLVQKQRLFHFSISGVAGLIFFSSPRTWDLARSQLNCWQSSCPWSFTRFSKGYTHKRFSQSDNSFFVVADVYKRHTHSGNLQNDSLVGR